MEYIIKVKKDIDFTDVPKAEISCYKWETGYEPEAYAQLIFIEGRGFALRMTAYEENPKAIYTKYGEDVYKDSCLEFFASFNPDSPKYINFEMNANGAFLSAVRTDRHNKTPIDFLAPLPKVTPIKGDGFWGVEAFFTLDFIGKTFGKFCFARGESFKGNFYKCGDETPKPHFGMWSPVELDHPDFHQPAFFGTLTIE